MQTLHGSWMTVWCSGTSIAWVLAPGALFPSMYTAGGNAQVGIKAPLGPHSVRARPQSDGRPAPCFLIFVQPETENTGVTKQEIDQYLEGLEEPKRSTLSQLRDTIMALVPDAEQCISYGLPAFKLRGQRIAGFAAFKNHLSYLPHSGSVIPRLASETKGYTGTKSALHFPIDTPLPAGLVEKLLSERMAEAFSSK